MGGYLNVEDWWLQFSKTWGAGLIADVGGWSPNATYEALHRFADAAPDPKTGANTEISADYAVKFVPIFIVRPAAPATPRQTASR